MITKHRDTYEVNSIKNQQQQTITKLLCITLTMAFPANPAWSKKGKQQNRLDKSHFRMHRVTIQSTNGQHPKPLHNFAAWQIT